MNELKAKLVELGLSEEMAAKALQTVGEFAKTKLPETLHGPIDSVLAGDSPDLGSLGSLFGGFKGFF